MSNFSLQGKTSIITGGAGGLGRAMVAAYAAAGANVVVASRNQERLSAPFFFNPAPSARYEPLPELCADGPPHYRPIDWSEFRALRSSGDYADVGKEVQIDEYRIG